MNLSRKIFGVALAVALFSTQITPVLATGPDTTTPGTGNIIDYNAEKYVVPTAIKIAFNPKASTTNFVITGYDKVTDETATGYDNTALYFKDGATAGTYVLDTDIEDDATYATQCADHQVYKGRKNSNQIVSLNYGIVNETSKAKTFNVKIAATYTSDGTGTPIEFVNAQAGTVTYNATSAPTGAKNGEMKLFLQVAPSAAAPTAWNYVKASGGFNTATHTYYAKDAQGDFQAAAGAVQADYDNGILYEYKNASIETEITRAELADVTMTAATLGRGTFEKKSDDTIKTAIGFTLGAASYGLKDGEYVTFDTTQAQLANKYEIKSLAASNGGVAGFTFTGAMNTNTEWSKAEASVITITPTYEVADATGAETAVDSTGADAFNAYVLPTEVASYDYAGDVLNIVLVAGQSADASKISAVYIDGEAVPSANISVTGSGKVRIAGGYDTGSHTVIIKYDNVDYVLSYTGT